MQLVKKIGVPNVTRSSVATWFLMTSAFWLLLYLVASPPNYTVTKAYRRRGDVCPGIYGQNEKYRNKNKTAAAATAVHIDCRQLLAGDKRAVTSAARYNWCRDNRPSDADVYAHLARNNCDKLKHQLGYDTLDSPSSDERDFPIAFSILTYEDLHQTERLLHAIYRPSNVYCVHVDAKADSVLYDAFTAISKCLPNVIVPSNNINVHWAEYSVLEAEVLCMKTVWSSTVKWKYYINLTGREYPLKTNAELVRILRAYNGGNDIDGNMYK